jgi:hypothetical protein
VAHHGHSGHHGHHGGHRRHGGHHRKKIRYHFHGYRARQPRRRGFSLALGRGRVQAGGGALGAGVGPFTVTIGGRHVGLLGFEARVPFGGLTYQTSLNRGKPPRHSLTYRRGQLTASAQHVQDSGQTRLTLGPLEADVTRAEDGTYDVDVELEPFRQFLKHAVAEFVQLKVEAHVANSINETFKAFAERLVEARTAAAAAEGAAAEAAYNTAYGAAHAAAMAAGQTVEAAVSAAETAGLEALQALLPGAGARGAINLPEIAAQSSQVGYDFARTLLAPVGRTVRSAAALYQQANSLTAAELFERATQVGAEVARTVARPFLAARQAGYAAEAAAARAVYNAAHAELLGNALDAGATLEEALPFAEAAGIAALEALL